MNKLVVKSWFIDNIKKVDKDGFSNNKIIIQSESEKAIKLVNEVNDLICWVPKSVIVGSYELGEVAIESEFGKPVDFKKDGKLFKGYLDSNNQIRNIKGVVIENVDEVFEK